MQVTPELLSTFICLKSLPRRALEELAPLCSLRRFARRAVVLNAGVREEHICFLFEGNLQGVDFTIDGREVGLYFVESGDFCGELGVFDDGPQPEFVIARTPAAAVFVPMTRLRELAGQHPEVMSVLARRLATRVRQLAQQRSLLSLPHVGQRVCCQLWLLTPPAARHATPELPREAEILNPPTHMEIAIMLNLSREAVSRVFQALQTGGIVSRDGPARLVINDLPALKDIAEGKSKPN